MNLKRTIKRIFFPEKCEHCGEIIPIECEACDCEGARLPRVGESFCEHCGAEDDNCCCGMLGSAFLPHVTAPFFYSGEIREKIHRFKFGGATEEALFFGHEMSLRFATVFFEAKPDFVCPVPITRARFESRGYNQSELLADVISEELLIQKENLLLKVKDTLNQHNLTKLERQTNLDGAFCADERFDLKGKTVLLCDDIKTTGTTLKKCSDALFAAGASDVFCLCVAVTDYFVPVSHKLDKTSSRI